MTPRPILLIGGTGVFGERLARHLVQHMGGIALFVSSRSAARAQQLATALNLLHTGVTVRGVALDHRRNLRETLSSIRPFIVVDCSGPFQNASYATAEAIIASGAHLVDLADARDYLAGFAAALDARARAQGVAALTGVSSTPALSSCVVAQLVSGWQRVDTIDIAITPGGKSEVGRAVIEAILSYAGRPIPVWRAGALQTTVGWTGAKDIRMPGLGRRRVAPVETFDAELLGPRHNVRDRISFSAGLESRIEQRGIEALATLRRHRLIGTPAPLIPLLLQARRLTRIPTSDRGGMSVTATGIGAEGRKLRAIWSLRATHGDGPCVPILAAAAAVRKLRDAGVPPGARLGADSLSLTEITDHMAPYRITTRTDITPGPAGVFKTALGDKAFDGLPPALRAFHHHKAPPVWRGSAEVAGSSGWLARCIARIVGFPPSGQAIPVTVCVDRAQDRKGRATERWTRDFDGARFRSVLRVDTAGTLTERFGPFTFTIPLCCGADAMSLPVSGWKIGPLPLPRILCPRSEAREYQDPQGRFCFDIRLTLPVLGMLAQYRGWLVPASGSACMSKSNGI